MRGVSRAHYVRTLTIGAFHLGALSNASSKTGADVGPAGAGAGAEPHRERDRAGGDLATCLNTQGATGCDAILQLGLVELNLGLKEGGFGTGPADAARHRARGL